MHENADQLMDYNSSLAWAMWRWSSKSSQNYRAHEFFTLRSILEQSEWFNERRFATCWVVSTTSRIGQYCERSRPSLRQFNFGCFNADQDKCCSSDHEFKKSKEARHHRHLLFTSRRNVISGGHLSRQTTVSKTIGLFEWPTFIAYQRRLFNSFNDINSVQLFTSWISRFLFDNQRFYHVLWRLWTIWMLNKILPFLVHLLVPIGRFLNSFFNKICQLVPLDRDCGRVGGLPEAAVFSLGRHCHVFVIFIVKIPRHNIQHFSWRDCSQSQVSLQ